MAPRESGEELPLLEDLGIDMNMIVKKFLAILTQRGIKEVALYNDMVGTIVVGIVFGFLLMCVSILAIFDCLYSVVRSSLETSMALAYQDAWRCAS